jgi:hypothetical protein
MKFKTIAAKFGASKETLRVCCDCDVFILKLSPLCLALVGLVLVVLM